MEQHWHNVLVVVWSNPFLSRVFVGTLGAAADEVTPSSCNSLLVDGESGHEDYDLEEEVSDYSKTSDQAEVPEGRYISEQTNEEGNALTKSSGEDGRSDLLHRETNALINFCHVFWDIALSSSYKEHIIYTDS